MNISIKSAITLLVLFLLIINKSYALSSSAKTVFLSDKPIRTYYMHEFPLVKFVRLYNQYSNITILHAPLKDNMLSKSIENKIISLNFDIYNCVKGLKCRENNIKQKIFSSSINSNIVNKAYARSISFSGKIKNLYLVVFQNYSLETKNFHNQKFEYMVFLELNDLNKWLAFIKDFDTIQLEKYLNDYKLEVLNKTKNCINNKSPFCLVKMGKKQAVLNYIDSMKKRQKKSIIPSLLIDYAYKTRNKEMAYILTKAQLNSINYPTLEAKIYAAAYYDLAEVVEFLLNTSTKNQNSAIDLDNKFYNDLTLLGVAVVNNSHQVIKYLIQIGAKSLGYYFSNDYKIYKNSKLTSVDKNNYYLFNQLVEKHEKKKIIPDLLKEVIYRHASHTIVVLNQLEWLKKLIKQHPKLFRDVFINEKKYARALFRRCIASSTEHNFDFLINQGLDLCTTFDEKMKKNLNMKKIEKGESSLGKEWIIDKYYMYQKQCEKSSVH